MDIHTEIKEKLDLFLKNNNVPHILFYGPHGSGKKTILTTFIKKIYTDQDEYQKNVMSINCALGKGIQFIREDIKNFAKERMADFKVPRHVVILDEIPKGATGKMQRIGMAEKLGLL